MSHAAQLSYFGASLHRVPQVAFNLGAVGVRLASHLQTIRGFMNLNTVKGTKCLAASSSKKFQTCGGILEPA